MPYKQRKNKFAIKPKLGQHFLYDETTLNKIVDAAEARRSDVILEIGPGTGSLTQKLAIRCRRVIAVELDRALCFSLQKKMQPFRSAQVLRADILKFSIFNFKYADDYKVVGNIPYYITGKIIRKFTANKKRPKLMVLTVQKEVAERVCCSPPKMNILAVSVQVFGAPEIAAYVDRGKFDPPPNVDSAILRIRMFKKSLLAKELGWFDRRGAPKVSPAEMDETEENFFRILKIGFSSPRKQIHNNLKNGLGLEQGEVNAWLKAAGVKRMARAQELGAEDWIRLLENQKSV